jgi:hypothetical protein
MLLLVCLVLAACVTNVKVEPVKVEPIHMTIDVNVHGAGDASPSRRE